MAVRLATTLAAPAFIAPAFIAPAVALAVALTPAQALAATSTSIDSTTCTKGGGVVVRQPIGPITQPLYKCHGGTYNGRTVFTPTNTHKQPSGSPGLPTPR